MTNQNTQQHTPISTVHHGKELIYSGHDLDDARKIAYNTVTNGKGVLLRWNNKIIFMKV